MALGTSALGLADVERALPVAERVKRHPSAKEPDPARRAEAALHAGARAGRGAGTWNVPGRSQSRPR